MSIWQTLSAIDVSDHIETKGDKVKLKYLSWTWAWATLMDHYPYSEVDFHDNETHADGTMTVHCTVTIPWENDVKSHSMWLPVMDHRNRAIPNPDARAISDAKMRCMVKCLALFGLGHYIYAGEDLPSADKDSQKSITRIQTLCDQKQRDEIKKYISDKGRDLDKFLKHFKIKSLDELTTTMYDDALALMNIKKDPEIEAWLEEYDEADQVNA